MDDKLKFRLVGASVILALAVFFLPMILDSEKYRSQIQSQIPAVPSEQESKLPQLEAQTTDRAVLSGGNDSVEQGPLVINLDEGDEQEKLVSNPPVSAGTSQQTSREPDSQEQPIEQKEIPTSQDESDKAVTISQKSVETQNTKQVTQADNNLKSQTKVSPESVQKEQSVIVPKQQLETTNERELAFSDSAWLVQIGSFSNKENATRLVKQLRDEGYRAYQRVGGSYARVYVGPYPVKAEAEQRTPALEKIVGSKVKVIEFDPKQH